MKNKILVFILLLLSVQGFSQQDSSWMDEVTVTALRREASVLTTPFSTQTLSRKQINHYQPRTTPEALTGLNGLFIQKTNHGGGSPFIRGFTGNQVLMLVDGIRLNNSTFRYGPNQYLNTIDPYSVEKIEVVKGAGSVQYGTDALGGVIQVLSKDPGFAEKGNRWTGAAEGKLMSSGMEKTARAQAGYQGEKTAFYVGGTYRDFGDLLGGDSTNKQSPSGYKEYAFDAKLKIKASTALELTLAGQFLRQQHVPVYHKVKLENFALNEFDQQQRLLNYARLQYKGKSKLLNSAALTLSLQQNTEGRSSQKNGSGVLRKEKDRIRTIGLLADISSAFSAAWTANSGVEVYLDKVNSAKQDIALPAGGAVFSRGLYPDDASYGNYSLYSLHHFNWRRWTAEAGVRWNTFAIQIPDSTLGKVTLKPSAFVYNAGVTYNLLPGHYVYANFNTGYRAPNIDDMGTLGIVDFRYELPAYDLKAEQSRNIEIGYKLHTRKWTGTVAAYYMHVNNLISRVKADSQVINGYPVYRKENVESAYLKGIEAELGYALSKYWQLSAGIAYIYGQNLTRKEPLRRIPPLNGRVLTRYGKGRLLLSGELLFATQQDRLAQGDKDDNRITASGTPGWTVLNLYAGYQFQHFRINIGLQNLFDEDYRTHGSGINGVGRSAWLALAVNF